MRSIWTGAIGFGLVNIPIKLFSAVQGSELDLDMLDKKDLSRIRFQRVNEKTGKEVTWENIVRGFDLDGKYVVLDEEDFRKASPEQTKTIDILQFVNESEIDPVYYETPYYLQPDKSGAKPYILLRDALQKSGKAGIGSFVLRNKESLCVLRVKGKVLILQKIRYQQEVRAIDELEIPETKPRPEELKMAQALIDQLSGKFDISQYKDTYTEQLMKFIRAKAKGKKTAEPTMKVVHNTNKDLMEQLKASLQATKRKAS